jgi:hypothetical protein
MLILCALYLSVSAFLEVSALSRRLPLAPGPGLSFCISMANCLLAYSMFKAVGWARPLVVILPLAAYPLEYGFRVPAHWSQSAFELLASALVLPACAIYCLYMNGGAIAWFRGGRSLPPNTSLERTRER